MQGRETQRCTEFEACGLGDLAWSRCGRRGRQRGPKKTSMILLVLLARGGFAVAQRLSASFPYPAGAVPWCRSSLFWVVCDGLPVLRGWTRELVERCSPGPCGQAWDVSAGLLCPAAGGPDLCVALSVLYSELVHAGQPCMATGAGKMSFRKGSQKVHLSGVLGMWFDHGSAYWKWTCRDDVVRGSRAEEWHKLIYDAMQTLKE